MADLNAEELNQLSSLRDEIKKIHGYQEDKLLLLLVDFIVKTLNQNRQTQTSEFPININSEFPININTDNDKLITQEKQIPDSEFKSKFQIDIEDHKLIIQEINNFKKYKRTIAAGGALLTTGVTVCSVICPIINAAFGATLLSIGGYLAISLGLLAIAIGALKLYFNHTEYKTINFLLEKSIFIPAQANDLHKAASNTPSNPASPTPPSPLT